MNKSNRKHISGYIEGYYGRQLTWDQRCSIVDRLHSLGMNTYVYAPKEDRYHRRDWQIPYPAEWEASFGAFVSYARKRKVTVVACLAPGLSFDYLSSTHLDLLIGKIRRFLDLGVSTMALLMDDISQELPVNCRTMYSSLGEAHGKLLGKIRTSLGRRRAALWFCPTVYTDEFSEGPLSENRYLQTLSQNIPSGIPLMWTGPSIVSEKITAANLSGVRKYFGRDVIVWDNLYANDYCPMKLIIGPYTGRSSAALGNTSGLLLNPTGLPHTDEFLLTLMSRFLAGASAIQGWKEAASLYDLPPQLQTVRFLLDSPFRTLSEKEIAPERRKRLLDALQQLIFDWKGPLHDEWYPYLYQAWVDLQAFDKGDDDLWVRKKYPCSTAFLLRQS